MSTTSLFQNYMIETSIFPSILSFILQEQWYYLIENNLGPLGLKWYSIETSMLGSIYNLKNIKMVLHDTFKQKLRLLLESTVSNGK